MIIVAPNDLDKLFHLHFLNDSFLIHLRTKNRAAYARPETPVQWNQETKNPADNSGRGERLQSFSGPRPRRPLAVAVRRPNRRPACGATAQSVPCQPKKYKQDRAGILQHRLKTKTAVVCVICVVCEASRLTWICSDTTRPPAAILSGR
nr:unnamed protein product [Callosobruchus chinensis]